MKRFSMIMVLLMVALSVLWLAGCNKDSGSQPTAPSGSTPGSSVDKTMGGGAAKSGTTIKNQTVSADCYNYYTWVMKASMAAGPFQVCYEECADLSATVTATRTHHIGFKGQVCNILNGGAEATENLKITVTLMKNCGGGTGYYAVAGPIDVDVSSNPVLDPNETGCYDYDIPYEFDPTSTCTYKVSANITITNHSGHLGEPYGPSPDSRSWAPQCAPEFSTATVFDIGGPITPVTPGTNVSTWEYTVSPASADFSGDGSAVFTKHICNHNVSQGESFTFTNAFTYNGSTFATLSFEVNTVGCTNYPKPPDNFGCGRTIGFYKTHAVTNLYGHNLDVVSAHLPISLGALVVSTNTQVVDIMSRVGTGGSSNGILKLYSQLLAAKLNIIGAGNTAGLGSDPGCVNDAIAAADAFLQTHNADSWAGLTKSERNDVLGWQSTFDQYNNGLLCATHCD